MNYNNLDTAAKLLGVNNDEYFKAKELFFKDKKEAILKYLGYEDEGDISGFTDFWYYYLAENTNNFFHNFGENNYTTVIENFILRNKIEVSPIDFDHFKKLEKVYNETLFDILISEVVYNLKNKDLTIFGINVGFNSNIYYVLPKSILKELKSMDATFGIFDTQKQEEIYGEIFKIIKPIEELPFIEVGDFVEKEKESGFFSTLFNDKIKRNYNIREINKDNLELVL